jgi:hypothetical protein
MSIAALIDDRISFNRDLEASCTIHAVCERNILHPRYAINSCYILSIPSSCEPVDPRSSYICRLVVLYMH